MRHMSGCSRSVGLAALMALTASALGLSARAQAQLSDEDRARIHFQTGTSYYDQGRYHECAGQFRDSYTLSGRAHLLLNVARCHELAGELGPAADALEEYLQREPNAPDRRTIEERIAQFRSREPASDSGGGGGGGADVTLPAVLLGIGGAFVIGGVITGIVTLDMQSSLDQRCPDRVCDATLRSEAETGQALAITTDVLLGAGIVAAAVGGVLLIVALTSGDDTEEAPVQAGMACDTNGCVGVAGGRF
ncbi:MAG: tol-pal system YbgF family protein [Sandaracinaceae bacterium]